MRMRDLDAEAKHARWLKRCGSCRFQRAIAVGVQTECGRASRSRFPTHGRAHPVEACDYVCHTHNIVPITRKAQHDGSGIPPLVELSNSSNPNGYTLIECDRFRQYAHPPNTLCLVHVPGRHGGIERPSNSRYGLVVRCDGDIVKFRDPSKSGGPYFESKNFSAIKLAPGIVIVSCIMMIVFPHRHGPIIIVFHGL
jgi:hypothetical protein